MPRDIFVLPRAARDLDDIAGYYTRESGAELAEQFAESFFDTISRLVQFPHAGVIRPESQHSLRELRSILVDGFPAIVVFYRVTAESIDVARVLHGSRDLGRALTD